MTRYARIHCFVIMNKLSTIKKKPDKLPYTLFTLEEKIARHREPNGNEVTQWNRDD